MGGKTNNGKISLTIRSQKPNIGKNLGGATTSNKISLAINCQDGDMRCFRVPADKKIEALLKLYCKDKNFIFREVTFFFNGDPIQTSMTLTELGMESGDEIDAVVHH